MRRQKGYRLASRARKGLWTSASQVWSQSGTLEFREIKRRSRPFSHAVTGWSGGGGNSSAGGALLGGDSIIVIVVVIVVVFLIIIAVVVIIVVVICIIIPTVAVIPAVSWAAGKH
jgi:predicted RND superfamily exporter protein